MPNVGIEGFDNIKIHANNFGVDFQKLHLEDFVLSFNPFTIGLPMLNFGA